MKYLININWNISYPKQNKKQDEPTILGSEEKRQWWFGSPPVVLRGLSLSKMLYPHTLGPFLFLKP